MSNQTTASYPEWCDLKRFPAPAWAKVRAQDYTSVVCDYESVVALGDDDFGNAYNTLYQNVGVRGQFMIIDKGDKRLFTIEELISNS